MSSSRKPTLLCYDGSASAKHAITVAATALARHPGVVLHVWHPPVEALADSFSAPVEPAGPPLATLERTVFQRATEIAEQGQRFVSELGWEVETQIEPARGDIGQTIVHVAEALDAELILLGAHGRTAAQPALLGSVSAAVLSRSPRPVLVVPVDA
ncbi:MAG: universal stress protein [Acidobacteriota bacterium]|nr:universal stress protein [Acidobacteriota bacterium]